MQKMGELKHKQKSLHKIHYFISTDYYIILFIYLFILKYTYKIKY